MKKLLFLFACCLAVAFVLPVEAVDLPNYAKGGNLSSSIQSKGKNFTDLISMIVAVLAIIGMLVGAAKFAIGNGEDGKKWVIGGVVALVLAGSVYGIAQMALS